MSRLVVLYFTGTGNTKYAVERLATMLEYDTYEVHSIEEKIDFDACIRGADDVMVAYPIIGGGIPIIMREFLRDHRLAMCGKALITIVTEAGFSGDGGALAYRLLDSEHITYKASYHIVMPTNVSFGKIFTIKNGKDLMPRITKANRQLSRIAKEMNKGKYRHVGASRMAHILGYHLQRKYFEKMEGDMVKKFDVDNTKCIRCMRCVRLCPMNNISLVEGHIVGHGRCTLCYRCLHACSENAISLIRREPIQYRGIEDALR